MNKILYEADSFFLLLNCPEEPKQQKEVTQEYAEAMVDYLLALKSCERIEIQNHEVLPNVKKSSKGTYYRKTTGYFSLGSDFIDVKPGDLFPIPEGIEWEIDVLNHSDCGSKGERCAMLCHSVCEKLEAPKKLAILKLKAQPGWAENLEKGLTISGNEIPIEVKGESQESIHDRILEQWEKDFGSITSEQKMDGYTVSGFVRAALKQ